MRKALVAGAVMVASTMATMSAAAAAPPGLEKKGGETWMCGGVETTIVTASGRSGWIGDTLYKATSLEFTGTFTPADGSEPQTETESKTWPARSTEGEITCTLDIEETSPEGTFVGQGEVIAVPVR